MLLLCYEIPDKKAVTLPYNVARKDNLSNIVWPIIRKSQRTRQTILTFPPCADTFYYIDKLSIKNQHYKNVVTIQHISECVWSAAIACVQRCHLTSRKQQLQPHAVPLSKGAE